MNAILIIGHAPLASALRQCALHVFPECGPTLAAIDVLPDAAPERTLAEARAAMDRIAAQPGVDGVLVLTDLFGATPGNIAQKLVDGVTSRLITGVNLPMLLRSVCYRNEALDALVSRAVVGGTQGVMQVASGAPGDSPTCRP